MAGETFSYDEVAGAGAAPDFGALEDKYGLPKGLLGALKGTERSGKDAVSPKGAKGVFQFMPATAKAYGLADPTDEAASADAAARYMADAMKRYGTNDPKVLAAEYNGGPVQAKAVLAGKAPPAAETQKYIANVAGLLGVGEATAATKAAPTTFSYDDVVGQPAAAAPKAVPKKVAPTTPGWERAITNFVEAPAEVAASVGSGMAGTTLGNIAALLRMQPGNLLMAAGGGQEPQEAKDAIAQALMYQPRTAPAQAFMNGPLAKIGALLHKGADAVGNKVADPSGPYNPIGAGVSEALMQAPALLGGGAAKAAGVAGQGAAPVVGARWWMQSAMKPTKAELMSGQADRAISTMLEDGTNVSRGGVNAIRDRVDTLNTQIADIIQNSPATIDKAAVGSRLQGVFDRFAKQVNPAKDRASIQKALDDFNAEWPAQIPIQEAQAVKQGTYRTLNGKYMGELDTASTEAQKGLARGLKEEIANAAPEVRPLNAEESRLLNTLPMVERRVLMDANKNPIGLGVLASSPSHMALWLADRSALFKSLVARMLNTAGEATEAAAPAGAAAGAVLNQPRR